MPEPTLDILTAAPSAAVLFLHPVHPVHPGRLS